MITTMVYILRAVKNMCNRFLVSKYDLRDYGISDPNNLIAFSKSLVFYYLTRGSVYEICAW